MDEVTMKQENKRAVCMVGTLVPIDWFQELQSHAKVKAAPSPLFLQKMIFRALHDEGEDVTCYGYPPVASFPGTPIVGFGMSEKNIDENLRVTVLPVLNLPLLKQISVFFSFLFALLFWEIRNIRKDRYILVYADFLEYCCPALLINRIFHSHSILYLTEMPGLEHFHTGKVTLKKKLLFISERMKLRMHRWFDGYVFITQELADAVNIKKRHYVVVEGFPDTELYDSIPQQEKESVPTLMYAGSLREVYNIKLLVDAFHRTRGDFQLWIYGNGKLKEYIAKLEKEDPRIQYRGIAPHKEILAQERKATLLAHIKDTEDEFVQYTFSSKLMEYFSSGTPVLTSHCGGVPELYFSHCYVLPEVSMDVLTQEIERIFSLSKEELTSIGLSAKQFLRENANCRAQGRKIIDLFNKMRK